MGLLTRSSDDVVDETMPQTVPSAGFTPPCDYSTFAENFDLSLLPSGDPLSPSTQFYTQSPPPPYEESIKSKQINITEPKIFTTFYPNDEDLLCQSDHTLDFRPDFQKLLESETEDTSFAGGATGNIYLEVPQNNFLHPNSPCGSLSPYSTSLLSPNDQFTQYRTGDGNFYPSSPEVSLYAPSPNSVYSRSPCGEEFLNRQYSPLPSLSPFTIKEENYLSPSCGGVFSSPNSPCNSYSNISSPSDNTLSENQPDVLGLLNSAISNKSIKQEGDFGSVLNEFQEKCLQEFLNQTIKSEDSKPKDHKLLREALRDTSFQKKFNIKPVDFGLIEGQIKMEEPDPDSISNPEDLISSCNEQIARENIEPVLNLAIEQMRKDVNATCSVLGISSDPMKWSPENVLSWVQWTCREFGMSDPMPEQWNISGSNLVNLDEQDFSNRSPQGGMILYAQLEIWKAACCEEDLGMQWLPDTTSSNASSGDVTDDEDEETSPQIDAVKPTTSARPTGSHIHLWQFLKELLASSQNYGSCIRWLDRSKGIFKIEDSVKVARLWGKRKNRPAMNYDKLSRSIRQYYKKGIMKKTERSQRLVYQFCHPYNL